MVNDNTKSALTPYNLSENLLSTIPEIENAARIYEFQGANLKIGNDFKNVDYFQCVDPSLFELLSIKILRGHPKDLEEDPKSIFISQSYSLKYFSSEDPIGKVLLFDQNGKKYQLTVKGVFEDIPLNSTFKANIIGNIYFKWPNSIDYGKMGICHTYVLLSENSGLKKTSKKLEEFGHNVAGLSKDEMFLFQPLKDLYLNSSDILPHTLFNTPRGNKTNLFVFLGVALLLISITLFNYYLINSGIAISRANEAYVRKIHGATKRSIFFQINFETQLTIIFPFIISILLVSWFIKETSLITYPQSSIFTQNGFSIILGFLILIILLGFITSYFILKKFWESNSLLIGQKFINRNNKQTFNSVLIFIQLVAFSGLLLYTLILVHQINLFSNKDYGYNTKNILVLETFNRQLDKKYDIFKNDLLKHPQIESISGTRYGPPVHLNYLPFIVQKLDGIEVELSGEALDVDYSFSETLDLKIIDGRFFDSKYPSDSNSIVINETFSRSLNQKEPIGMHLDDKMIIGIVKDFNLRTLHHKIDPLVLLPAQPEVFSEIFIRCENMDPDIEISLISSTYKNIFPDESFNIISLEDRIMNLYSQENQMSKLFISFTFLSILLSSLGLFGLTSLMLRFKSKEFAIRKIHGAKPKDLFILQIVQLIKIFSLAFSISIPITIILINNWLNNFAYKVTIGILPIVITLLLGLGIIVLSVGIQTIVLANKNLMYLIRHE